MINGFSKIIIRSLRRTIGQIVLGLFFVFCLNFSPQFSLAAAPTEGLAGYWNFDENSGTVAGDFSGGAHNGILTNGPVWSEGNSGAAITFDGTDDFVGMGDVLDMGTNDFTISAWVKTTSTTLGATRNGIVYKRTTSSAVNAGYRLSMPNGTINFNIADGTNYRELTSGSGYNDGNWHSVVAVADRGSTMKLYVDGNLIGSTEETNVGSVDSTTNFAVGALNTGGAVTYQQFNGSIDEVRIYNRALSQEEAVLIFGANDIENPESPICYADPESSTAIRLSWNIPADNYGLASYDVFRDGSKIASTPNIFFVDSGLSPDTEYQYAIVAHDAGENISPPSETVRTRTFHEYSLPDNSKTYWNFNAEKGFFARDMEGGYLGNLMDGADWTQSRRDGAVLLDGTNDRIQDIGTDQFEYTGGNMSFSIWYWADSSDTDEGFIMSKAWNGSGDYNYRVQISRDDRVNLFLGGEIASFFSTSGRLNADEWNHIIITLSSSGDVKIYLNGTLDLSSLNSVTDWIPPDGDSNVSLTLGCIYPYGSGWVGNTNYCVKGKIDNFRIYNDVLSGDEVNRLYAIENRENDKPAVFFSTNFFDGKTVFGNMELLTEVVGDVDAVDFAIDGENIGNDSSGLPYHFSWDSSSVVNGSYSLGATAHYDTDQELQIQGPNIFVANGDGVAVETVRAISDEKILPSDTSIDGISSGKISIIAARGEFEPASFVVRPAIGDLHNLNVTISNLQKGSDIISSSNVDVKAVKIWYQSGSNAWTNIQQAGGKTPNLVPELLLNDDGLVAVDTQSKTNAVRLPDDSYFDISNNTDITTNFYYTFSEFPVSDSSSFQPVALLSQGNMKQFWLTVHVPENTPSGTYNGMVNIFANGSALRTLNFELTVPDFDLVDSDIEHTLYYTGKLNPGQATIGHNFKTEQQYRAEMLDLKNHGVNNPTTYQDQSTAYFDQELSIRREYGMNKGPLYSLGAYVSAGFSSGGTSEDILQERLPGVIEKIKSYGFSDLYLYGKDEASGDELTAERSIWQFIHGLGAKIFVAGYNDSFERVGDLLDTLVHASRKRADYAEQWHGAGHKIYSYGDPQIGAENPRLYRKNYGVALWAADYDGAMDFAYQYSFGKPWNDFDHATYRDHNFTYPTQDGVVGTIAWEGYREAYDDNRYIATLEQAIAYANNFSDSEKIAAAAEAQNYLDSLRSQILTAIGTGTYTANFAFDLDNMKTQLVYFTNRIYEAGSGDNNQTVVKLPNPKLFSYGKRKSFNTHLKSDKITLKRTTIEVAGGKVQIKKDGKLLREVSVDSNGKWEAKIESKKFTIHYIDQNGDEISVSKEYKLKIDDEKPEIKPLSPLYIKHRGSVIDFEASDNDKIQYYRIKIGGRIYKVWDSKFTIPQIAQKGPQSFTITAYDKAGNKASKIGNLVVSW